MARSIEELVGKEFVAEYPWREAILFEQIDEATAECGAVDEANRETSDGTVYMWAELRDCGDFHAALFERVDPNTLEPVKRRAAVFGDREKAREYWRKLLAEEF